VVLAETMVAQHIAFGVIAAVVVGGALMVVTTDNVVRAALYLVAVLAGVGGGFLLLGAEFVGITQILVYIGAIVVLFLFGIMLTRAPIGHELRLTNTSWVSAAFVAVALAGVLGYTLIDAFGSEKLPADSRQRLHLLDLPHSLRSRVDPPARRPRRRHRSGQEGMIALTRSLRSLRSGELVGAGLRPALKTSPERPAKPDRSDAERGWQEPPPSGSPQGPTSC